MPASTSTITTAKSKAKTKEIENARLRVSPEAEESVGLQEGEKGQEKKGWEKHENDFFWTYTEEPHRTRRMAIIKAHPEVCLSSLYSPS